MRSVPRNIDRKGEHLSRCDYCGVMWLRSSLRRGRNGLLRCPNDSAGRDELELAEATARRAEAIAANTGRGLPADGAVGDVDSQGNNSSSSQYTGPVRRFTADDVYNGDVPTVF